MQFVFFSNVDRCQTIVLHITNVGPPLDLLAAVGEPVVHFQGGDPLQVRKLLSWNTSRSRLISSHPV